MTRNSCFCGKNSEKISDGKISHALGSLGRINIIKTGGLGGEKIGAWVRE